MELQNNNKKLGVVCCYFNPCNYLSKFLNYTEFIYNINKFDIHLITVESYNDNSLYRINEISDNTISVYSDDVYWQKEGLLNIGIQKLLDLNYEYIAWIDADVKFLTENWPENTIENLTKYKVVQLFKQAYKESENKEYIYSRSIASNLKNKSVTDNINQLIYRQGELGYGYGYHADILKTSLLYDMAIVGAGDFLNLIGLMYCPYLRKTIPHDRFFSGCNSKFVENFLEWSRISACVDKIGYCDSDILVKYHGSQINKRYINRERILKNHKFCPDKDLAKEPSGLYKILNPKLGEDIKKYFVSRLEDDYLKTQKNKDELIQNIHLILKKSDPKKKLLQLSKISKRIPTERFAMLEFNQSSDIVVVASKIKEEYFSLNRLKCNDKILIDKSQHTQPNSLISKNNGQHNESYLNFIVKFYTRLPCVCIFINETIKKEKYINLINKLCKEKIKGYRPILDNIKPLMVSGHIVDNSSKEYKRSNQSFKTWWNQYVQQPLVKNMHYYSDNHFMVDRDTIYKHSVEYYRQLLESVSNDKCPEEELYLNKSWVYIFR